MLMSRAVLMLVVAPCVLAHVVPTRGIMHRAQTPVMLSREQPAPMSTRRGALLGALSLASTALPAAAVTSERVETQKKKIREREAAEKEKKRQQALAVAKQKRDAVEAKRVADAKKVKAAAEKSAKQSKAAAEEKKKRDAVVKAKAAKARAAPRAPARKKKKGGGLGGFFGNVGLLAAAGIGALVIADDSPKEA